MSDLIYREDALMALTGEITEGMTIEDILARTSRRIRDLPSVQTERTGHWEVYDKEHDVWNCSECKKILYFMPTYPYCPFCGVKMEGME